MFNDDRDLPTHVMPTHSPAYFKRALGGVPIPGLGLVNHHLGGCIWFHSTLNGLVDHVLGEGLRINSLPTLQEETEPLVYLSTKPFIVDDPDFSTLAVYTGWVPPEAVHWPFGTEARPLAERWQVCLTVDVPPRHLWLLDPVEVASYAAAWNVRVHGHSGLTSGGDR